MNKFFAMLATVLMIFSGLANLLNPFWWFQAKVNPLHDFVITWSKRTRLAFKLDMMIQNIFGLIIQSLRSFWIKRLITESKKQVTSEQDIFYFDWKNQDKSNFFKNFQTPQKPTVLKNFLSSSKSYSPWDLESFLEKYGEEEVTLSCPIKDGYQGKLKEINIPGVYLHNSEILMQKYPELFKYMGFDQVAKLMQGELNFSGVAQLFAGKKKTGTWWHCAGGINIFLMLEGQKKWSFINPAFSPFLFPKSVGKGRSAYYISEVGMSSNVYQNYLDQLKCNDKTKLQENQNSEIFQQQRAFFDSLPRHTVTLNPGDLLMIPAWWWHDVENITDNTMAVASRWFDSKRPKLSNNVFDIGTRVNPSFFYTAISGVLEQTVIKKGELLLKKKPVKEYLTQRTRANGLDKYAAIDESVQEYYNRFKENKVTND